MHITNLRTVGGSVMLTLPPAILDILNRAGATVGVTIDGGRLVVEPQRRPHHRLEELLAQCDASAPLNQEDREWIDGTPVGAELL